MKHIFIFAFMLLGFAGAALAEVPAAIDSETIIKNYLSSKTSDEPGMQEDAQTAGSAAADLDGDGKPEIILVWTTLGPTYWHNTLTVFADAGDGYKPAATYDLTGEAAFAAVKDAVIYVDEVLYADKDPICCPTIKKQMKYRWAQDQISEVK